MVASSDPGDVADSQYICAFTFTSVGVEIGICITSRRDCSSVRGLPEIRWIAWRRLGRVIKPNTTNTNRIAIVVLSPRDTALFRSCFVDQTNQTLLEYIARMRSEGNVWLALPREVANWWRQRRQMKLVRDNGAWRIDGLGKERARIAYVAMDGGKISYEIESSGKQAFDFG